MKLLILGTLYTASRELKQMAISSKWSFAIDLNRVYYST
jgi:hypothetical protein